MTVEIERVNVKDEVMWLAREFGTDDVYESGESVGEAVKKVVDKNKD